MPALDTYEFRAITANEMREFHVVPKYVFADNTPDTGEDDDDDFLKPEYTNVAFSNGKIVATAAGLPFTMYLNGRTVAADGLTAVGTLPDHRRRGLVRRLVTDRFHIAHEQGVPVSILWASMAAIYQRFGYGAACTHTQYSFDPRNVALQDPKPTEGEVRLVNEKDGADAVRNIYTQYSEPRSSLLVRSDDMWKGFFGSKKHVAYCAIHYDENGTPDGYVSYRTRENWIPPSQPGSDAVRDQRMNIKELLWLNIEAYRALWGFIASHDLVRTATLETVPADDPAWRLLLEPRELRPTTIDGIWMRILDVKKVLLARHYGLPGSVTLEIKEDAECPWNVGRYLIETDGTESTVRRIRRRCDIEIPMNGLASLVCGEESLRSLVQSGRAYVRDATRLNLLDATFRTTHAPVCLNGF